jgi:hypothetical protein
VRPFVDYGGCSWVCWSGGLFLGTVKFTVDFYLPSFITTVSCPGCLRMWTAIAAVGTSAQ